MLSRTSWFRILWMAAPACSTWTSPAPSSLTSPSENCPGESLVVVKFECALFNLTQTKKTSSRLLGPHPFFPSGSQLVCCATKSQQKVPGGLFFCPCDFVWKLGTKLTMILNSLFSNQSRVNGEFVVTLKQKHQNLTEWWVLWHRSCVNLQYLSLAYCYRVTEKGLSYLNTGKGCRNLIHLNLSGCNQVGTLVHRHSASGQVPTRNPASLDVSSRCVSGYSLRSASRVSAPWLSNWAQLLKKAAREGSPLYTPTQLTMHTAPYHMHTHIHNTCAQQHTFLWECVLVGFQVYGLTL